MLNMLHLLSLWGIFHLKSTNLLHKLVVLRLAYYSATSMTVWSSTQDQSQQERNAKVRGQCDMTSLYMEFFYISINVSSPNPQVLPIICSRVGGWCQSPNDTSSIFNKFSNSLQYFCITSSNTLLSSHSLLILSSTPDPLCFVCYTAHSCLITAHDSYPTLCQYSIMCIMWHHPSSSIHSAPGPDIICFEAQPICPPHDYVRDPSFVLRCVAYPSH